MAVRAFYGYEYMASPATEIGFTQAPQTDHVNDAANRGLNFGLIKMLNESPTPLQIRYWKTLITRAQALSIDLRPIYNLHNSAYLKRYAHPLRRYRTTAGPLSILPDIACPIDPAYLKPMIQGRLQAIPKCLNVAIDIEFPGSPGGFHYYVAPCHCVGCRVDWWRSVNSPTEPVAIDPNNITLPSDAVLLAYEQSRHQALMTRFAQKVNWKSVSVTDISSTDSMTPSMVAGLIAAGHTVTVLTERTYPQSGVGNTATLAATKATVAAAYPNATIVGGLWQKQWSPDNRNGATNNLTTAAQTLLDYWLFTTYSEWLGSAAVQSAYVADSTTPYSLELGTAPFTVAGCSTTLNVATLSTSNNFTTAGVIAGCEISGTGIPLGTSVLSVDSAISLTMSYPASATGGPSLTITFGKAPIEYWNAIAAANA